MPLSKVEYKEMQKAVIKALKYVMDAAKHEPSVIIISGSANSESDCPIEEITAWLFHRRPENDNTGN